MLVNYHKLDAPWLERIIYTFLNEWIRAQRAASKDGTEARLLAALGSRTSRSQSARASRLTDVYVRRKPLHQ